MLKLCSVILSFVNFLLVIVHPLEVERPNLHNPLKRVKRELPEFHFKPPQIERDPLFWNNKAETILKKQLNKNRLNKKMAKNVIFFLGDGMGISTQMASRMYKGGEELELSFENFPFVGLSKTYCANAQVADSACSATSYLCGVKANYETIGLSASVIQDDCLGQNETVNHVFSIIKNAQDAGMRTGVVTNTRITHATPAGVYAHISNRNWENDAKLKQGGGSSETCPDIAYQFVHNSVSQRLNLMLGGGRREFILTEEKDIDGNFGRRSDINLINEWKRIQENQRHAYVETRDQLLNVDNKVERLLGLFDSNHLPFNLDENSKEKPSLIEMVSKALDILKSSSDEKGFFLFVEGGKIDHAHHDALAKKALDETIQFEKAVELARMRTDEEETLIVVTADHSHSFTVSGYASRGNNILGLSNGRKSLDGLPYTTLGYENGPSSYKTFDPDGKRADLRTENLNDDDFAFPAHYPLKFETHGGEDVGVFASGPHAHLFTGVYEQNYIPHAIKYIACLGDGLKLCEK